MWQSSVSSLKWSRVPASRRRILRVLPFVKDKGKKKEGRKEGGKGKAKRQRKKEIAQANPIKKRNVLTHVGVGAAYFPLSSYKCLASMF